MGVMLVLCIGRLESLWAGLSRWKSWKRLLGVKTLFWRAGRVLRWSVNGFRGAGDTLLWRRPRPRRGRRPRGLVSASPRGGQVASRAAGPAELGSGRGASGPLCPPGMDAGNGGRKPPRRPGRPPMPLEHGRDRNSLSGGWGGNSGGLDGRRGKRSTDATATRCPPPPSGARPGTRATPLPSPAVRGAGRFRFPRPRQDRR